MAEPTDVPCPSCGGSLEVVPDSTLTMSPDTAPYLCNECARGYWAVELTPAYREVYDPATRSYPMDVHEALIEDCLAERDGQRVVAEATRAVQNSEPADPES